MSKTEPSESSDSGAWNERDAETSELAAALETAASRADEKDDEQSEDSEVRNWSRR